MNVFYLLAFFLCTTEVFSNTDQEPCDQTLPERLVCKKLIYLASHNQYYLSLKESASSDIAQEESKRSNVEIDLFYAPHHFDFVGEIPQETEFDYVYDFKKGPLLVNESLHIELPITTGKHPLSFVSISFDSSTTGISMRFDKISKLMDEEIIRILNAIREKSEDYYNLVKKMVDQFYLYRKARSDVVSKIEEVHWGTINMINNASSAYAARDSLMHQVWELESRIMDVLEELKKTSLASDESSSQENDNVTKETK
jgi:hypothetical protein